MKTSLLASLLLSFICLLALSSCKKELDDHANFLYHNTDRVAIPFGAFKNENNSGTQLEFTSIDPRFEYIFTGPCYKVNVPLHDINIVDGRYTSGNFTFKSYNDPTFDTTSNFDLATVVLAQTYYAGVQNPDGTIYSNLTGGSLTLKKNIDIYTIDYVLHFGTETITGNFTGKLYNEN
jgi:hypothetical protein